jgi:hypothetical protein
LPLPNTATASRQDVIDYFNNVWAQTEVLFACLQGAQNPAQAAAPPVVDFSTHNTNSNSDGNMLWTSCRSWAAQTAAAVVAAAAAADTNAVAPHITCAEGFFV